MEQEEKKEQENEKENIIEWCKKHPKVLFFSRLCFWAIFSAILPFCFIAWKYQIFSPKSQMPLTGWGFIAILIVTIFIISLIKYIYKGLKPGLLKQCIFGVVSIIFPLILLYLLVISIESNISLFKQSLGCVILCEAIGIPLNPFPAWLERRRIENKQEEVEHVSDIFWDKFFNKKKEGE